MNEESKNCVENIEISTSLLYVEIELEDIYQYRIALDLDELVI